MHETLSSFPEQFGDGTRKAEIKSEILKETDRITDNLKCGWFWFRPIYLQKFRTAKWALFWLCWAGAMQGMYYSLMTFHPYKLLSIISLQEFVNGPIYKNEDDNNSTIKALVAASIF